MPTKPNPDFIRNERGEYQNICVVCLTVFWSKRANSKFCKRECRNKNRTKGYHQVPGAKAQYSCLGCGDYWPSLNKYRRICPNCREHHDENFRFVEAGG